MNIIAFPHYTCGGLLCDILNNEEDVVLLNGGFHNKGHHYGKMGDSVDVFDSYDASIVNARFKKMREEVPEDYWISTHCWPGEMDLTNFNKIVSVTTETYRSKSYRWLRCCHHYFKNSDPWLTAKISDQSYIDKVRETAKNYLKPFRHIESPLIENIEFADIVECKPSFQKLVADFDWEPSLQKWKNANLFLYDSNLWVDFYIQRLHEAEHESLTSEHYVYQ